MIATWMFYGIVVALLAAVSAAALEGASRLLGRAGRWWWVGAMLVTLALPVIAWMRPLHTAPTKVAAARVTADVDLSGAVALRVPIVEAPQARPFDWSILDRPLGLGWAIGSLGLIGWFGVGVWRLRRMRRTWRPDGDLMVSEGVGPAVVGFFRCCVVVPEWSLALGAEQRELLLAHEAEHLAAYDSRLLWSATALLVLMPWNPGLWWQFRRLRLAIELDCDGRVLAKRPDAATYGRLLLEVGARVTRTILPVTAFYEPMSSLERRIRSMTAKRPRGAAALAAVLVIGAAAALASAYAAPRPAVPVSISSAMQADSFMSQHWLHQVLEGTYGPLLSEGGDGSGIKLWFLGDTNHEVHEHVAEEHAKHAGVGNGDLARLFPGLPADAVLDFHTGEVTGFNRKGVQMVWVDLAHTPAVKEWLSAEGSRLEAKERLEVRARVGEEREALEHEERERGEASGETDENMARTREIVAKYYPELLKQRADPPVVLWFLEPTEGNITKHLQTPKGKQEGVGEVPEGLVGPGHFDGSISVASISRDRKDVTVVMVHPNKAR